MTKLWAARHYPSTTRRVVAEQENVLIGTLCYDVYVVSIYVGLTGPRVRSMSLVLSLGPVFFLLQAA